MNNDKIRLNEILNIEDISNCKIRLLKTYSKTINPLDFVRDNNHEDLMNWLFWNYKKQKSFKVGQKVIGLVKIDGMRWLLFNVSTVNKDLDTYDGVGYEYSIEMKYRKYFFRVIVEYHNKSQNLIRNAAGMIDECIVYQIIEDKYEDEEFPGYENISISWEVMNRVLVKNSWRTALQNQKEFILSQIYQMEKCMLARHMGKI